MKVLAVYLNHNKLLGRLPPAHFFCKYDKKTN